jgi:hypothetical protein
MSILPPLYIDRMFWILSQDFFIYFLQVVFEAFFFEEFPYAHDLAIDASAGFLEALTRLVNAQTLFVKEPAKFLLLGG